MWDSILISQNDILEILIFESNKLISLGTFNTKLNLEMHYALKVKENQDQALQKGFKYAKKNQILPQVHVMNSLI